MSKTQDDCFLLCKPHSGFPFGCVPISKNIQTRSTALNRKVQQQPQVPTKSWWIWIKSKIKLSRRSATHLACVKRMAFRISMASVKTQLFYDGITWVKPYSLCEINYLLFHFGCHSNWHNKHPRRTEKCWKFHFIWQIPAVKFFFRNTTVPHRVVRAHEFTNILNVSKLTVRSNRLKNGWCVKISSAAWKF